MQINFNFWAIFIQVYTFKPSHTEYHCYNPLKDEHRKCSMTQAGATDMRRRDRTTQDYSVGAND